MSATPNIPPNTFLATPDYKPLPGGVIWESTSKLIYNDPWGGQIQIPAGFKSDFASIPDLSRIALYVLTVSYIISIWIWQAWFVVVPAWFVVCIAEKFLHEGTWDSQSFLHDWMYATRCRTFWQANWILFVSMRGKGGDFTPAWKRVLIFIAVSLAGYMAWVDDARKKANR